MSRKKLILIVGLGVLLLGGLIYAGYQFVFKKGDNTVLSPSNTQTNSAKPTNADSNSLLQASTPTDTQMLDIDDIYFQNNGMQSIFIPNTVNATGDKDEYARHIQNWIINPQRADNVKEVKIKQVAISTQNDEIIIRNGASLKDYILGTNVAVSTSENDLIVQANPAVTGYRNSFLLIKSTNPQNFSIANKDDWFASPIFFIPKEEVVILKLNWPNASYGSVAFSPDNKIGYEINLNAGVRAGRYDYGNTVSDTQTPTTNLPGSTPFLFLPPMGENKNLSVYHVVFADKENKAQLDKLLKEITQNQNAGIAAQVQKDLAQTKKHISSFSLLKKGSDSLQIDSYRNGNTSYAFSTTKDENQGILLANKAYTNFFAIKTGVPFSVNMEDAGNERDPYQKQIRGTYPIDQTSIKEGLNAILGSGNRSTQGRGGSFYGFSYKIQPKKIYTGDMVVKSVFGDKATLPVSLYIETISDKVVVEQILSNNTINILPNEGSFQDVLIQTKNTPTTTVEFQACTLGEKINTTANQGGGLENQLFSCSGPIHQKQVSIKDFVYRKAYRTAVALPEGFSKDVQAFKVTLPNAKTTPRSTNNTTQYFYKSNIGLRAKISYTDAYVRGFSFSDNTPITEGTITVKDLNGAKITSQDIKAQNNENQTVTKLSLRNNKKEAISEPVIIELTTKNKEKAFVIATTNGASTYYSQGRQQSKKINSFLDPQDITNSTSNIGFRGYDIPVKIYGYTDKALYKAGENVYFAGFVRDLTTFENLNYLQGKTVNVTITDTQGRQLFSKEKIPLDAFGGFNGIAELPTALSLGDAIITYTFNAPVDSKTKYAGSVTYSQNIKIEEYQKPTYFADITQDTFNKENILNLVVDPKYYFGQSLSQYDIKLSWSLAGKGACYYCWREPQEDFYYNQVFNDTISTGGETALYNQTTKTTIPLFNESILEQKGYQYSLKASAIIRDKTSNEVQYFTKYIDFDPIAKIGLSGSPFDWLYNNGSKDTRKDYKIEGKIDAGKGKVQNLDYEVYYYSYEPELQQGIDGNTYYVNGTTYSEIKKGSLAVRNNFDIPTEFIQNPGMYLLRVFATDSNGTIIGEVQKQIDYYDSSQGNDGMLGSLPNNYALTVSIPKKIYEEGEKIPVDIEPYQKGARVILTVERGDQIIDTIEKTLDGEQLSLVAKKGYAPNIVVNVMQVVGTDKSQESRKEPRFFAGFAQAEISTAMHELNISVKPNKDPKEATYKPGEKVTIEITTTDSKNNPVEARISIGVVDKALLSLYDSIKEPIPYFFNKLGTNVSNYTNMKLLYQSLKAFANNGSKGGGGNGGQGMFSMIREELEDVAFWRGGIFTTGGKATVEFVLPDNITTWTVDVIGITKDTKLGTARQDIIATKDLIIEANAPQFVTLGDKIDVPVKVIVSPNTVEKAKKIVGKASLQNDQGEKIDIGDFSADRNSQVLLSIQIPNSWTNSHFVQLVVSGSLGDTVDGVMQTIPLRTAGLLLKDSAGTINKSGTHTFTIPESISSNIEVTLGLFPTNMVDAIITSLVFYENASSQNIAGKIQTALIAKKLDKEGVFTSKLIKGDKMLTNDIYTTQTTDGYKNISSIINDGITTLIQRQQSSNGLITQWDYSTSIRTDIANVTPEAYMINAHIYGTLLAVRGEYTSQERINATIQKLEKFLWDYRDSSDIAFMRYLTQKAQAGNTLSDNEIKALNALEPLKIAYGGLLRYAIALYQGDAEGTKERKQYATIPTNETWNNTSIFINQSSALLLKTDLLFKDNNATDQERMESLQNMIKLRGKDGDRGSSLANLQGLKTLSHLNQKNLAGKDKVSCDIFINDKKHDVTVDKKGTTITAGNNATNNDTTIKENKVSWSCDATVLVDPIITFVPKNLEDALGANQHVPSMKYSIENSTAEIGTTTNLLASWSTDLAGEQLAVNIYLPATFKQLHTIQSHNTQPGQEPRDYPDTPFTISDYKCRPTHREVRFDKLFLYYDSLAPISCDISIPLLKAYDGQANIMPMTVSELYKGAVNGRKIVK